MDSARLFLPKIYYINHALMNKPGYKISLSLYVSTDPLGLTAFSMDCLGHSPDYLTNVHVVDLNMLTLVNIISESRDFEIPPLVLATDAHILNRYK